MTWSPEHTLYVIESRYDAHNDPFPLSSAVSWVDISLVTIIRDLHARITALESTLPHSDDDTLGDFIEPSATHPNIGDPRLLAPDDFGFRTMVEDDCPNDITTIQGALRQAAWILTRFHSTDTWSTWINYFLELIDHELSPTIPELYRELITGLIHDCLTRLSENSW